MGQPTQTGNPGEDFGCRCWAEPYEEGKTEYAYQTLTTYINDNPHKWIFYDFVLHALGSATDVTLSEIGHLHDIIYHYGYIAEGGIFKRVNNQIIDEARNISNGTFPYPFTGSYSFKPVSFPHGGSTVEGIFKGYVSTQNGAMKVEGTIDYIFDDTYTDPTDIRELLHSTSDPDAVNEVWRHISDGGGKVYKITDRWSTEFHAEAKLDENESIYKWQD